MMDQDKVNILLVDDQPAKLLAYEVILKELGENLIKASSGREALEFLLKNDVAIILVDVCMPELDGFELAAMIREHPRFQKIAMIFISAIQVSDIDRLRGYEMGAVDYVPVPVDVADLDGGDEYHRRLLEAGMFADHGRELEPIQFRHADVDEDDGNVVLEQELERFPPGRSLDQVLAEFLEDDFIGEQLRRLIVNQKNVYLVLLHHLLTPVSGVTTFVSRAATARY